MKQCAHLRRKVSRLCRCIPALFLIILFHAAGSAAFSQALVVLPVNIQLAAEQKATFVTVLNRGASTTSIQVRGFAWNQDEGQDELIASDDLLVSPPMATIPPGGKQVVRLVLRHPEERSEGTYRIIIDQIPPPATPGFVRVVLRLSIPVFIEPDQRAAPRLQFQLTREGNETFLVAHNDGLVHQVLRDIDLVTDAGTRLKTDTNASPYILAGATRRWHVDVPQGLGSIGESAQLAMHIGEATLRQQVPIVGIP